MSTEKKIYHTDPSKQLLGELEALIEAHGYTTGGLWMYEDAYRAVESFRTTVSAGPRKKAYFAHCKQQYGTLQEARDQALLSNLGFDVVNPADKCWEARWKEHDMAAKDLFAAECDLIVFRGLPGGKIPQGVFKEIAAFRKLGKPVLELPSSILEREQTLEQTREYLAEIGQR